VQNAVERRVLGTATATTSFFRALGGAIGAAVLGAVFAAQAAGDDPTKIGEAVQVVFWAATPLTALALAVVLRLPEVELRTHRG
jgi:Na+/melibiose symporter-like transporter